MFDSRMETRYPPPMTDQTPRQFPPRYQQGVSDSLAADGLAPETIAALLALDSAIFLWHRMAVKGEVPGKLIAELGLGLDPAQFFALTAVTRIEGGIGRAGPEAVTVGLLAEEMAIDPSRASRIASDLIAGGFLRREADQSDGRRAILRLTDRAIAAMEAFRDLKWSKFRTIFGDWTDADIVTFAGLFDRYVSGVRQVYGIAPAPDAPAGG